MVIVAWAFDLRFKNLNKIIVCASLCCEAVGEAKRERNSSNSCLSAEEEANIKHTLREYMVASHSSKKDNEMDEFDSRGDEGDGMADRGRSVGWRRKEKS